MEQMEQDISKYSSLQTRLVVGFTILGTLITAITIAVLYLNFRRELRDELRQRLASITSIGALYQDGDLLLKVEAAQDEYFEQINEQNLKIKRADPDVIFVYTMMKDEQGIYFIVDAGVADEPDLAEFGAYYEEPSSTLVDNFDTLQGTILEPDFYTDEYGTFLSAYAPIYKASGEKIGVFGVDINASTVIAKEQSFRNVSIFIFLGAVLIITLSGFFLGRLFTTPIANLAEVARTITEGNLNARLPDFSKIREIAQLSQDFNRMTASLGELIGSLEERVKERTSELEVSVAQIQNRASQLEAIADVASSIASLHDINQLLPYITQTVSERFGFYHAGIFLLSEDNEYAVLNAANSEGGQAMLARKHQLRVGQEGVVGFAAAQKRAHIALDVGEDAVYFNNPDLPATRSEMALPLIVGEDIIGVLDVQSEEPNAFSDNDIVVLNTLANQVAVAIENARLFHQSKDALKELDATFQRYISNDWKQFTAESKVIGYRALATGLEPITGELKDSTSRNDDRPTQNIPITLRGATLGSLNIDMGKLPEEYTEEEMNLIKTVADRLALALEGARLLEESQSTAAKEQAIGEITGKIGASINMRNVLQTAVEELGRAIPGSEIVIQFKSNADSEAK